MEPVTAWVLPPAPFRETVPELLVKVPLLAKLPVTVKVVEGAVTAPAVMVKLFATVAEFAPKDQAPDALLNIKL